MHGDAAETLARGFTLQDPGSSPRPRGRFVEPPRGSSVGSSRCRSLGAAAAPCIVRAVAVADRQVTGQPSSLSVMEWGHASAQHAPDIVVSTSTDEGQVLQAPNHLHRRADVASGGPRERGNRPTDRGGGGAPTVDSARGEPRSIYSLLALRRFRLLVGGGGRWSVVVVVVVVVMAVMARTRTNRLQRRLHAQRAHVTDIVPARAARAGSGRRCTGAHGACRAASPRQHCKVGCVCVCVPQLWCRSRGASVVVLVVLADDANMGREDGRRHMPAPSPRALDSVRVRYE